jgi:tape measure domain-containing protein
MTAGGMVSQGITVKFSADLSSLTNAVSSATSILQGFSGNIGGVTTNITNLGNATAVVSGKISAAGNSTSSFSASLGVITGSLQQLASNLGGVISGRFAGFVSGVQGIGSKISEVVSGPFNRFVSGVQGIGSRISDTVSGPFNRFVSGIQSIGSRISDTVSGPMNAFAGGIQRLSSTVSEAASGAFSRFTSSIQSFSSDISKAASGPLNDFIRGVKSLSSNVSEAVSGPLSSFISKIQSGGAHISNFASNVGGPAVSGVSRFASSIGHAAGGLLDFASKVGSAITGFQSMVSMAMSTASALLGPVMSAEQLGIAFTTLTGSAEAATATIKELNHFADVTPFEPQNVQEYAAQLMGMKISGDQTIPIMTALGDALFAIGHGTAAEMSSVVDVIGKINIAGKMTYGDLSQLATHGIDAAGAIGAAMGKTTEEVRELASAGLLPAKDAIDALTKGIEMNPLYQGGMAKQASSLSGIISTLSGYIKNALNSFLGLDGGMIRTGSLLDMTRNSLANLAGWMQTPAVQQFATDMGEKVGGALQLVGQFVENNVVPWFREFMQVLQQPAFKSFASGLSELLGSLGDVGGAILNLWEATAPVVNIFKLFNQDTLAEHESLDILAKTFRAFGSVLHEHIVPAISAFGKGIKDLTSFLRDDSIQAQIFKDLFIGISVAFAAISFALIVIGFTSWAIAAGAAAITTIAATLPIIAIGAAIALVVAGIILVVQHWGDIMGWITGKTNETRIGVEQSHVKMRIAQDENTAKGAQAAINNMEKEKIGIRQKLMESHDETEKAELTHQYNMLVSQEQAQVAKLKKAEDDKKAQLAKQKELHAEMEEAQKPWIVRMGDGIKYGFEAAWHWISDRAIDAWNWIKGVFAPVGGWFNDRWNEIKKWWGEAGQWFQGKFTEAKNAIINAFGPVGQVFQDKWNEISTAVNGAWKGIVSFSKEAWKGIVAGVKAGALAVLSALIYPFIAIGQLFIWLYNHNYYIKALVDHIVDFFKGCLDWIKMAWTASINWLVGAWTAVAKFATDLWKQVSGAITGAVKVAWDWLVSVWTTVSTWLVGVWTAVAKFATDLWKQVSGAITGAVKVAWDWLVSVWTTVSTWLVGVWTAVAKFATDLWNKIATAVHDGWVKAVGFVTDVWNQIAALFTNAWNTYIVKPLTALWTSISNVFSSAWNSYVSSPLSGLWNSISTWFVNLGNHALQSGKNFIQMIVNGINSGVGSIWNAVVNIANTIWKALGFHSPAKEGPGSDADNWMPNMVAMLSDGMNSNVGKIKSASDNLAASIKNSLGTLAADARGWSIDMINQFVQGILKGVGAVGNAASKIASAISANLHFSKPDIGPLADADKWMPDFGNLLAAGLKANVSKIQSAAALLAKPISVALSPSALNSQLNYASLAGGKAMQAASSAQPIIVQVQPGAIYLDGHEVTNRLAPHMANMIRLKGDMRSR